MHISMGKLLKTEHTAGVSFTITCDNGTKETLWYSTERKYERFLSLSPAAAVTALLVRAMVSGENITTDGTLPIELINNLDAFQAQFIIWVPSLKHVTITPKKTIRAPHYATKKQCLAFSGGVDSFYSLLKLRRKLTYALLMHGFDIPLSEKEGFRHVKESYRAALPNGMTLIPLTTNLKELLDPHIDWVVTHAAALLGSAMVFKKLYSTFYISSGYEKGDKPPYGSHPNTDPLLSNGSIVVRHYGEKITRTVKTAAISHMKATYTTLHVCCWLKGDSLNNCCRCSKCIRTMIPLQIEGKLQKYTTFPKPLTQEAIRNALHVYPYTYKSMVQVKRFAKQKKAHGTANDISISLSKSYPLLVSLRFAKKTHLHRAVIKNPIVQWWFSRHIS